MRDVRRNMKSDYFLSYTEEDLNYEFDMFIGCRRGIEKYTNPFLHNLCIEGWLLHARRIIEAFRLNTIDNKWNMRWGLISEHLSHAKPSNRTDPRKEMQENPKWKTIEYYDELIDAVHIVADQNKSDYDHYDLLISKLNEARSFGGK